jgi:hypothetical protein
MILPCVHCGTRIKVPAEMLGKTGECPACHGALDFPQARSGPPSETVEERKDPRRLRDRLISSASSIAFHLALLLACLYFASSRPISEGGQGPGYEVGFAELPGEELTHTGEGSLVAPSPTADAGVEALDAPLIEASLPADVAGAGLEAIELAMVPSGGGSSGGAGAGLEIRPAGGGGGGGGGGLGKARFMGVEAKGNRFCIIADRSSSMAGPKLEFLKSEILRTISDLEGDTRFFIIFYNSMADPMPGGRWLDGRENIRPVANWLQWVVPAGGTNPLPAFQLAFAMNPRPDTIFFMTDGLFPPQAAYNIAAMNSQRNRVVIHTISFVDRSSEAVMFQIAEQSGGRYRHVDGP